MALPFTYTTATPSTWKLNQSKYSSLPAKHDQVRSQHKTLFLIDVMSPVAVGQRSSLA